MMVEKIANQNQQSYKVIVAPAVIRKVDETIRRIQLNAVVKGDPTLWLWADHLGR